MRPFYHDNEEASVGYLGVLLKNTGIQIELASAKHAAIHRCAFPESEDAPLGQGLCDRRTRSTAIHFSALYQPTALLYVTDNGFPNRRGGLMRQQRLFLLTALFLALFFLSAMACSSDKPGANASGPKGPGSATGEPPSKGPDGVQPVNDETEKSEVDIKEINKKIDHLTDRLGKSPDDVTLLSERGKAYAEIEKGEQALADFDKVIALKPTAENYNNRALVLAKHLKKMDEALAGHTKAIELDPNYATAYKDRAEIYREMATEKGGNEAKALLEKALADLNKALQIDAEFGSAYSGRGEVYEALGKTDLAKADAEMATKYEGNKRASAAP